MAYTFTQPRNSVMFDTSLPSTAKVVYCAILKHVDSETKKCNLYMKTLAQEVGRSIRTIQRALNLLIGKGLIIRRERFGRDGGNVASSFTVISTDEEGGCDTKDISSRQERRVNNNTLENNSYLKGEETPPSEKLTLNSIPEIMRPTARYLLQRTGRKELKPYEIQALKMLAKIHTPARVQKEIDKACARFAAAGRKLYKITANYLQACLGNQRSFKPKYKVKVPETPMAVADEWIANFAGVIL
ncbi:MAG: helix-turn-helix domain-containing protein [Synergistaceae bacterium]|nr:helix-turn-helix domain-containing protein [Synergistaceae bacterium]